MSERRNPGWGKRHGQIWPRALGGFIGIMVSLWLGFQDVDARVVLDAPMAVTQVPRSVKAPPAGWDAAGLIRATLNLTRWSG